MIGMAKEIVNVKLMESKTKVIEVYGVKGFNKELKCRSFQYQVGNSYNMPIEEVKLCKSGFHFSPSLYEAACYYALTHSRFCLVKTYIPENKYKEWTSQPDKIVSNNITIIRELTSQQADLFFNEEKWLYSEKSKLTLEKIYRLEELKIIQTAYPTFSVGGSVGLWLQGFNIKRDEPVSDFDFVIPYYQRMDLFDFKKDDMVTEVDQMDNAKNSGNDFDYTNGITIEGDFMLMDMKINPKAKYININYDNFTYKVCPWEIIIDAKMRYLNTSTGEKHRRDLMSMFGNPKPLQNPIKEVQLTHFQKFLKDEGFC